MQSDGNLVLYSNSNSPRQALWSTKSDGKDVAFAIMQGDGNFVVYAPGGTPIWHTHTDGNPGAFLQIQDDGNLVLYSAASNVLWATYTVQSDERTAFLARDGMEFTVKVSRSGIVETNRCAGIKKQSGTYHHYFWFAILDEHDDTIWLMPEPLTLTIDAATTASGKPSFTSKRDYANFSVPTDIAKALDRIAIYLERQKSGNGSLLDQIEQADRIYTRLKNMEVVKDLIAVVAAA
jgi:hypothetical protein